MLFLNAYQLFLIALCLRQHSILQHRLASRSPRSSCLTLTCWDWLPAWATIAWDHFVFWSLNEERLAEGKKALSTLVIWVTSWGLTWWEEKLLLKVVLWPPYACSDVCLSMLMCTHMNGVSGFSQKRYLKWKGLDVFKYNKKCFNVDVQTFRKCSSED